MKLRGTIHEVAPGVFTPYPQTREAAMEEDVVKFHPYPTPVCPDCGMQSVRYTKTDICAGCAAIQAAAAYKVALDTAQPITPDQARKAGFDFYWRPDPGRYCGHVGMVTLSGACYTCRSTRKRSPRQLAIDAGSIWYDPDPSETCRNGHHAPRRVNNGSCKQCEDERNGPQTAPIWMQAPDMVISRADAQLWGLKAYRTGDPCRSGHRSWRYLSNGACLACMGRV